MTRILSHQPGWRPPFCPNPKCRYHRQLVSGWAYKKIGFYYRRAKPRRIQRYLCHHCGVSFSCQTFSVDYWLKRPELLPQLMLKTCGAMANRQAARDLGCCGTTVDGQLSRLGRHCLLFHSRMLERARPAEAIVIDGLESFELSQYFPFHHHVAVEPSSAYWRGFSDSPLRRKGRMTRWQRRRRQELERRYGRPDAQAVRADVRQLLEMVLVGCEQVVIYSDDHRSYPLAMRGLGCRVLHRVTSSQERRTESNALWEVNLLDLLIRHGSANHRRQTLAWSKRRQRSAERLGIFLVWRNYVQRRWVKGGEQTPAMAKGLCSRPWGVDEIMSERLFVGQIAMVPRWRQYYWGEVQTPALGQNRRHTLKRAF
jgi:transposase-like protein